MNSTCIDTPIGTLRLCATEGALTELQFEHQHDGQCSGGSGDRLLTAASTQLSEYFDGARQAFDVPLAPAGTAFQQAVWSALCAIPFGSVRSYAELARAIDRPTAVRAVGAANGRNPLPIFVPCHRVIGSDGSLTGFAGGLAAKQLLLQLEGGWPDSSQG